jgi:hypothetical protein
MGKRNLIFLLKYFIGLSVSLFGFLYLNRNSGSFENLALGTETATYQAKNKKGQNIHFLHLDKSECSGLNRMLLELTDSITLILGNSQTHSINQLKNNEVNYVELISREPQYKNKILALSFPNANLQELFLSYHYVLSKKKVSTLILPIFMDDLREDGIREAFFSGLMENGFRIKDTNEVSKSITGQLQLGSTRKKPSIELEQTTQEKSESFLNNYLNAHSDLWAQRENMRGNLFNWTYMLRNTILGIRPGSVRKMMPDQYGKNMQALEEVLKLAQKNKTQIYLYIPPIRSDVPLPYDKSEYETFKNDLSALCQKYNRNTQLKDFSKIVPGNLWGFKEATNFIDKRELDFMHFQYKGHQILADSLIQFITKY